VSGLAKRDWRDQVYMAGSAALSLYLGHRPVRDLDFMSSSNRLGGGERRDLLADLIAFDPATRVETARDGYLFVRFSSAVGAKFHYYPYPLIDPEEALAEIAVASPVDLGLMKLGAIISRGSRRDFIDLYLLCQELPLSELLGRSREKFGHVRDFPLQALKGLADLSLTDGEPMPQLSQPLEWGQVQDWLQVQVRTLARQTLGLDVASGSEDSSD
jgi:hypothetical protein